jgi:beta-N-acetylhexosaminidase
VLGQSGVSATEEAFRARQELVFRAGANVNFGVVADVSGGPGAYIHDRSFSEDPSVVADHVRAAVAAGIPGVAQTVKHFPGHGMVFVDTHIEVPSVAIDKATWREIHGAPFLAGLEAGAQLVMMAHIRVPSVSKDPASLSDDWIAILRDELGFTGVVVTDDLGMLQKSAEAEYQDLPATVVAALVAGNDLLLLAADPKNDPEYEIYDRALDALVASVESGNPSTEQVDQSLRRVLMLRWQLGRR